MRLLALCIAVMGIGCATLETNEVFADGPVWVPVEEEPKAPLRIDCPTAVREGARDFDDLTIEESAHWALLLNCIDEHVRECEGYQCIESTEDFGSPPIMWSCMQCVSDYCATEIAFCLQP